MILCQTIDEIRNFVREAKIRGQRVGFVPTMGYLHQGHLQLMREARKECDVVVVSIYVNPMQFGPQEDLARYPRDLEQDMRLADEVGVDAVFAPADQEMYPRGFSSYVDVAGLTQCLCGLSRPGHFRGVATVVTKLFNIVQPDRAYFGQKDAQQVMIIKRMTGDLNLPVEIVTVPTVREEDGLAMSSRNVYLDDAQRRAAVVLSKGLMAARESVAAGQRDAGILERMVRDMISAEPLASIDYVEIRSLPNLEPVKTLESSALLAMAVKFGKTRLIDNAVLEV